MATEHGNYHGFRTWIIDHLKKYVNEWTWRVFYVFCFLSRTVHQCLTSRSLLQKVCLGRRIASVCHSVYFLPWSRMALLWQWRFAELEILAALLIMVQPIVHYQTLILEVALLPSLLVHWLLSCRMLSDTIIILMPVNGFFPYCFQAAGNDDDTVFVLLWKYMMISVRVVVILTAWSAMLAAMLTIMRSRMELYHRSVILMSLPRCQLQRQYVSVHQHHV